LRNEIRLKGSRLNGGAESIDNSLKDIEPQH
jgi:hypothetical protein